MFDAIRQFRSKLASGQVCVGSGITLAEPAVTEAIADSVDFLWIDLEHSHLSYESVLQHLIACRAASKPGLVRVRGSEASWIKPVLDIGADGIIVPQVESAAEVRDVVAACRYPQQGRRGYGPRRASLYGRHGGREQMDEANRCVFVSVQVENAKALADLDAIVATEGLDSIVIGPHDLSFSLGLEPDLHHPELVAAIETIVSKSKAAGKSVGAGTGASEANALRCIELGIQWLQCGDDYSFMVQRAEELFGRLRRRGAAD